MLVYSNVSICKLTQQHSRTSAAFGAGSPVFNLIFRSQISSVCEKKTEMFTYFQEFLMVHNTIKASLFDPMCLPYWIKLDKKQIELSIFLLLEQIWIELHMDVFIGHLNTQRRHYEAIAIAK